MPYTTSGIFERIHNWEEDRINGIEIVTDHHDAEDDNFAAGLSMALVKDGRSAMEGNLNMSGHRIIGCAKGVNLTDAITLEQLENANSNFIPIVGDCIIQNVKQFNDSPLVPTLELSDASKKSANTLFVHNAIDSAFQKKQNDYLSDAFPTYETVTAISSGFQTDKAGYVIFSLPPRMVGSIQIGAFKQSFSYSYNNTQPTLAIFPIAKGVTVNFSGCSAVFTSAF